MSSRRSAPVLDLRLGSSRILSVLLTGVTLLACAAVCASGVGWPLKAGLVVVLAGAGGYWTAHEALRVLPRSVVRLVLMPDHECILVDRRGRMRNLSLESGVAVGGHVVILSMGAHRVRKETLCAFPDAAHADGLRRLSIHVRLLATRRSSLFSRARDPHAG